MIPDNFKSARLIYTGLDGTEGEDAFLRLIEINQFRSRPFNERGLQGVKSQFGHASLLGVVICLSPTSIDSAPIKIGVLCLEKDMSEPYHRATEMSIDILPEYQNKGYGSEAIKWAMDWAFKTGGIHRVVVECYGYNVGAARLYRRLGFVEEGKKRDYLWHEGEWCDLLLFSMLESDWKKLNVVRIAKTAAEKALPSVDNGMDELTKEFEKRNYDNC